MWDEITEIIELDEQYDEYDIETGTSNFYANGILVHNSSATFYMKGDHFGVCSRNFEIESEDQKTYHRENHYWGMAKKYDIESILRSYGKNIAVQAEVIGQGIQKNHMGIGGVEIRVFDVWDIDNQRYYNWQELKDFCSSHSLPMVKNLYEGVMPFKTVKECLEFADKLKYDNGQPAEGFVLRPQIEMVAYCMRDRRMAFKTISNLFLLSGGED